MQVQPETDQESTRPPLDRRRCLQLVLATFWLLDGVLQLQPMMFGRGGGGLASMMREAAAGNPGAVGSSIRAAAGVVDHHAALANSAVALIQIGIALAIAWRPTLRAALAVSVVWSLMVWWFGEGLGGVLHGAGTVAAGGPGSVLLYAVAALLLWPVPEPVGMLEAGAEPGRVAPFAAAGWLGPARSRALWAGLWGAMALLCLLGSARTPSAVAGTIEDAGAGQPGWLAGLDHTLSQALAGNGLALAVALCVLCLVVAGSVYLPPAPCKVLLAVAVGASLALWLTAQGAGMILSGGSTDPNSGPLLALLALSYWPSGASLRRRAGAVTLRGLAGVS